MNAFTASSWQILGKTQANSIKFQRMSVTGKVITGLVRETMFEAVSKKKGNSGGK